MFVHSYEIFNFRKSIFVHYFFAFVYFDNKELPFLHYKGTATGNFIVYYLHYFTLTGIYSFSLPQG